MTFLTWPQYQEPLLDSLRVHTLEFTAKHRLLNILQLLLWDRLFSFFNLL